MLRAKLRWRRPAQEKVIIIHKRRYSMRWNKVWNAASVVGLTLTLIAGCARVSTQDVMMRGPGLPKPELIIVHDYQVSRDEVQLDSGIGSRIERLVQGTPEEQDRVKLEQSVVRAGTATLVDDFYTTAKSSRKPGLGPMSGAGAAAGDAATTAAASAGIGFASERSQTAEADAQHAAREIAKELAKFFVEQGWITHDAANKLFWDR